MLLPKKTYYQVLGVAEDADDEEIRRSARAMSEKYHPDRVSHRDKVLAAEYEKTLKEINEAKQCLLDPVSRQRYNNLLRHQRAKAGVANIQVVAPPKGQSLYERTKAQYAPAQRQTEVNLPPEPQPKVVEMELEDEDGGGQGEDIWVPKGKVALQCPGCRERFTVSLESLGESAGVKCPNCGLSGDCDTGAVPVREPEVGDKGAPQAGHALRCPSCGHEFKVPDGCAKGDVLECPYCGVHGSLD